MWILLVMEAGLLHLKSSFNCTQIHYAVGCIFGEEMLSYLFGVVIFSLPTPHFLHTVVVMQERPKCYLTCSVLEEGENYMWDFWCSSPCVLYKLICSSLLNIRRQGE